MNFNLAIVVSIPWRKVENDVLLARLANTILTSNVRIVNWTGKQKVIAVTFPSTEMKRKRDGLIAEASDIAALAVYGRVATVRGLLIEIAGPVHAMQVGGRLGIEVAPDHEVACEVIGFTGDKALAMPFGTLQGVRRGCRAFIRSTSPGVRPSHGWLGRVINGLGEPIDGLGPLPGGPQLYPFRADPPAAHARTRVGEPLDLGVRALDTFLTCCRGQRMGIFAGSGVGKSVLLSMLARNARSDVAVIGLIGERGREVQEFLTEDLGPEGLARSVVIVATSDEAALVRKQAAYLTLVGGGIFP